MKKEIIKEGLVNNNNQPYSVSEINNFKFKLDWKEMSLVVNLIENYEYLMFQDTIDIKQLYSILIEGEVIFDGSLELSVEEMKEEIEQRRIQLLELRRNLFNQNPILKNEIYNIKN